VVQASLKLVLEPIFEADFNPDLSQGLKAAAGVQAPRFLDVDFRAGV
jgi:hypothetical protein